MPDETAAVAATFSSGPEVEQLPRVARLLREMVIMRSRRLMAQCEVEQITLIAQAKRDWAPQLRY